MQTKSAAQIVYIDEAGIDNRDDYPYGYCEIGQRFYALKSVPFSFKAATDKLVFEVFKIKVWLGYSSLRLLRQSPN